eukprot:gene5851-4174_t
MQGAQPCVEACVNETKWAYALDKATVVRRSGSHSILHSCPAPPSSSSFTPLPSMVSHVSLDLFAMLRFVKRLLTSTALVMRWTAPKRRRTGGWEERGTTTTGLYPINTLSLPISPPGPSTTVSSSSSSAVGAGAVGSNLFAPTRLLLGRWSSRDFMRGRSKRGGSVHTRHTHGRKGKYARLQKKFGGSAREGRRHAVNRLSGALGVKLGGGSGLFGHRSSKWQHFLSHATPEAYELAVYGHPHITNPYRAAEGGARWSHPRLQEAMANAAVAVQLVVLLPRVSRAAAVDLHHLNDAAANDGETEAQQIPTAWRAAVEWLLSSSPGASEAGWEALDVVHWTTLDYHVQVSLKALRQSSPSSSEEVEREQQGRHQEDASPAKEEQQQQRRRRRSAPIALAQKKHQQRGEPRDHENGYPATSRPVEAEREAAKPLGDRAQPIHSSAFLEAHLTALAALYAQHCQGVPLHRYPAATHRTEAARQTQGTTLPPHQANTSTTSTTTTKTKKKISLEQLVPADAGVYQQRPRRVTAPAAQRPFCLLQSNRSSSGSNRKPTTAPGLKGASPHSQMKNAPAAGTAAARYGGTLQVLEELQSSTPHALRVCQRIQPYQWRPPPPSPFLTDTSSSPQARTVNHPRPPRSAPLLVSEDLEEDRVGPWRHLRQLTRRQVEDQQLRLAGATREAKASAAAAALRCSHPSHVLSSLVRWRYAVEDPRAHFADALGHAQRRCPVVLFMDLSKVHKDTRVLSPAPHATESLVSRYLAQRLEAMGYIPLPHTRGDTPTEETEEDSVKRCPAHQVGSPLTAQSRASSLSLSSSRGVVLHHMLATLQQAWGAKKTRMKANESWQYTQAERVRTPLGPQENGCEDHSLRPRQKKQKKQELSKSLLQTNQPTKVKLVEVIALLVETRDGYSHPSLDLHLFAYCSTNMNRRTHVSIQNHHPPLEEGFKSFFDSAPLVWMWRNMCRVTRCGCSPAARPRRYGSANTPAPPGPGWHDGPWRSRPAPLAARRGILCFFDTSNNSTCPGGGSSAAYTMCRRQQSSSAQSDHHRHHHRQERGGGGDGVGSSSSTGPNYYRRLGIASSATTEEIKAAYRQKVLECHPDVATQAIDDDDTAAAGGAGQPSRPREATGRGRMTKAEAESAFRAVSEAYAVLSDPTQRAAHDAALGVMVPRTSTGSRSTTVRRPTAPSPTP